MLSVCSYWRSQTHSKSLQSLWHSNTMGRVRGTNVREEDTGTFSTGWLLLWQMNLSRTRTGHVSCLSRDDGDDDLQEVPPLSSSVLPCLSFSVLICRHLSPSVLLCPCLSLSVLLCFRKDVLVFFFFSATTLSSSRTRDYIFANWWKFCLWLWVINSETMRRRKCKGAEKMLFHEWKPQRQSTERSSF